MRHQWGGGREASGDACGEWLTDILAVLGLSCAVSAGMPCLACSLDHIDQPDVPAVKFSQHLHWLVAVLSHLHHRSGQSTRQAPSPSSVCGPASCWPPNLYLTSP
jgi:hypothetical protein